MHKYTANLQFFIRATNSFVKEASKPKKMASNFSILFLIVFGTVLSVASSVDGHTEKVKKRELPIFGHGYPFFGGGSLTALKLSGSGSPSGQWSSGPWNSGPSPSEVANAIAAAKQASANVLIAQQQMQAAKENVLKQQRMAMERESAAAILTQKSQAAAAIQRSEAAAAAQGVVLAQQRLAASKSAVSHQQRIAAAKEAEAASALQRSAHAAAAEIQKSEYEASKLGTLIQNGAAAAAHHLTLAKDNAFGPINSGTNHVSNLDLLGPWQGALIGGGVQGTGKGASWL